jgi:hypothetical protein
MWAMAIRSRRPAHFRRTCPLAGLKGTVIEVKSGLRLILSLPLLQRSVAVEVDSHCVDFDHAA